MQKLANLSSFESFEISKRSLHQLTGGRSKGFYHDLATGRCSKVIDDRNGNVIKAKAKDRFEDKCD